MAKTEIHIGRLAYHWSGDLAGYEDCFALYVDSKPVKNIKLLEFRENYLEQCKDAAELMARKLKDIDCSDYVIRQGIRTSSSQLRIQSCKPMPLDGINAFRHVLEESLRKKVQEV